MDIGTIDTKIYSCIADRISTNRVVITDKQLDHIAEHHPEAYDEALIELKTTLQDPDYIFEDTKHAETGLVVREIPSGNHLFIVLRVCTGCCDYANSVISGWKISQNRLDNYLRNKRILFTKSE